MGCQPWGQQPRARGRQRGQREGNGIGQRGQGGLYGRQTGEQGVLARGANRFVGQPKAIGGSSPGLGSPEATVTENNGCTPASAVQPNPSQAPDPPTGDSPSGDHRHRPPLQERLEAVFERFLWRLRLIAILPVIMSLASTGVTFVLGTLEIDKAILGLSHAADAVEMAYTAKLLGAVVTGIDLYSIGNALLIFGYGVYERLISPIDEGHQGNPRMRSGLLGITSLDPLKEKLVKVLVVALIGSAFKARVPMPTNDDPTLALFCLAGLLLALSGYLVASDGGHHPSPSGAAS